MFTRIDISFKTRLSIGEENSEVGRVFQPRRNN